MDGLQIKANAKLPWIKWIMKSDENMRNKASQQERDDSANLQKLCDSFARETKLEFSKGQGVGELTTFGVGGKADLLVYARAANELARAVTFVQKNQIPFFVLGGGSNTLVSDKRLVGAVIVARESKAHLGDLSIVGETAETLNLQCDATVSNSRLLKFCIERGLSQADYFAGIPGVVGGSIFGNAGTKYGSFSQIISGLEMIDTKNEIQLLGAKDIAFSYRKCQLPTAGIILKGFFQFTKVKDGTWKDQLKQRMTERAKSQPIHQATAGCTFKNGADFQAGKLIEELGLKGLRVGGAQVSETHANFIVNLGGATFSDIKELIQKIKSLAKEKRAIDLTEEIRIVESLEGL